MGRLSKHHESAPTPPGSNFVGPEMSTLTAWIGVGGRPNAYSVKHEVAPLVATLIRDVQHSTICLCVAEMTAHVYIYIC